ncbi:NAD-dependent 4,6-dehydratase LegB [Acetivibrio cellulolyticus]|uniref:NAD-dependent 4,6-dehydratase LegB n=1 Tax=Acetivibrio cellulolyticus TaxID=35830 RepID=UPI0001E2FB49|nr:NAD-dependent 4,6-dehydratase LegB [Acetivibrio cellulolyticus]
MELKGKKVFVTGAEGFIGSHLTEALVGKGCNVTALVQYNSFGNWGWIDTFPETVKKEINVVSGDIRDYFGLKSALLGNEVVMHLAALIAIPYSYSAPDAYAKTNVLGTLNVMQACRECDVLKVVHTSTSEVYGTAKYVPIDENHPVQGQSPYSASKIGADKIVESYFYSYNVPAATIRPFNTYGPRQSARAIIPTVITQILSGKKEIKVGNLKPTRDLNYVSDTIRGFMLTAERDDSIGQVINIGSGREISIGDLVNKIANIMGKEIDIISEEQRMRPEKSEVFRLLGSIEKASKILGYEPQVSLDEGLEKTIKWLSENVERYKTDIYNV